LVKKDILRHFHWADEAEHRMPYGDSLNDRSPIAVQSNDVSLVSEITDTRNANRATGHFQRVIDIKRIDFHGAVSVPTSFGESRILHRTRHPRDSMSAVSNSPTFFGKNVEIGRLSNSSTFVTEPSSPLIASFKPDRLLTRASLCLCWQSSGAGQGFFVHRWQRPGFSILVQTPLRTHSPDYAELMKFYRPLASQRDRYHQDPVRQQTCRAQLDSL
jgi:hypothetical protein